MRRDVRLLRRCPGRHRQAGSEDSSPEDFFSHNGKHHQIPKIHIPARPVQKPLPIYVAGHTEAMFRSAARNGYRVLSSGRVGGAALLAEQYQIVKDAIEPRASPTNPHSNRSTAIC